MKKQVFVIGFSKCGTNNIWSGLYRDPDLEMVVGNPNTNFEEIEVI